MNEDVGKAAWLAARRKHLTSTDSPAILGESPFSSPLNVFCRKLGIESEPEATERMELGSELQVPVANLFARRTGRAIAHVDPFLLVEHPEISFLAASLDAFQEVPGKGRGLLEIKVNLGSEPWGDSPPTHYQVQVQHALLVTGATWGSLCSLQPGGRLIFFDIEANPEFQAVLVRVLTDFWNENLVKQEPPTEGWAHPAAREAIRALYPQDAGTAIALPDEAGEYARRWDELDSEASLLKKQVKAIEEQKVGIENRLMLWLGSNQIGTLPDGTGFRWHSYPVKEYHVEARIQRAFHRLSPGRLQKYLKG